MKREKLFTIFFLNGQKYFFWRHVYEVKFELIETIIKFRHFVYFNLTLSPQKNNSKKSFFCFEKFWLICDGEVFSLHFNKGLIELNQVF